jgi:hypothetical protein
MQEKEAMNLTNPRKLKVTKSLARFPFSLTFNNLSHQPNITTKLDLTDSHTYTENPSCTYGRYTPTRIGRLLNNETKEPNRKDRERDRDREKVGITSESFFFFFFFAFSGRYNQQ